MDYEQKYREALEMAKKELQEFKNKDCDDTTRKTAITIIHNLFSELKESEDERIRKGLIEYLQAEQVYFNKIASNVTIKEALNWLEKQGKKPADKIEPKFKVGDWVSFSMGIVGRINTLDDVNYHVTTTDGYNLDDYKISKQRFYHLWSINDARDGDVLVTSTGQPFIFSGKYDDIHYGNPIAYCGVNWENKFKIGNGTHWTNKNEVAPATKEQRVLLFAKMKEAGYEWDADKKELKKMEVASKESGDEKIRKDIIAFLLSKNRYMTPNEDWDFHNKWLVWLEKQREKLDPDKVIGWLIANICDFEYYVNLFRKDFGL